MTTRGYAWETRLTRVDILNSLISRSILHSSLHQLNHHLHYKASSVIALCSIHPSHTLHYNGNNAYSLEAGKSKALHHCLQNLYISRNSSNTREQTASNLQNLKFEDSPLKKPDFMPGDKENLPAAMQPVSTPTAEDLKKPITDIIKKESTKSAEIKEMEAQEPLLMENPSRFVLFPLK